MPETIVPQGYERDMLCNNCIDSGICQVAMAIVQLIGPYEGMPRGTRQKQAREIYVHQMNIARQRRCQFVDPNVPFKERFGEFHGE